MIETEVKEILDKHEGRISSLEENVVTLKSDVTDIKTNQIKTDEQLRYIIQSVQDVKENITQLNNSTTQSISVMSQAVVQMINAKTQKDVAEISNNTQKEISENTNNTQLQITKDNNRIGLYGKLLIVLAAFFGGSKASELWVMIKEIFK